MKTKFQLMTVCVALLSAGITSCKKEGVIVPQTAPVVDSAQNNALTGNNSNLRTVDGWRLTKQGNNTLTYSANNKLQKVVFADGSVISYNYGYINGVNFITGECVKGGKSIYKTTYYTDAAGRAYQMKYKSDLADMTFNLIYQNGRLVEQKRNYGLETYKFIYDGQNRLSRMDYYGSDGVKKEAWKYLYHGQPLVDNYQINPEEAFLDRYLSIFGTFSQHLVYIAEPLKKPNFTTADIQYVFGYQQNIYGMVTERKKYKADWTVEGGVLSVVQTAKYEYAAF
jgi:hypothetical protein